MAISSLTSAAGQPASFEPDDSKVAVGPNGQLIHQQALEQLAKYEPKLWEVREGVWSFVGNGLSNQTFIEAPEGLICIDTGECAEEMQTAIDEVRKVTDSPIAAVIYSHFHYVSGTSAVLAEVGERAADIPIWAQAGVDGNLQRQVSEVAAAASRGLIHQFGILLPQEGESGILGVGLGNAFRNPDHAPYTYGYVPPTHTVDDHLATTIAGLEVELTSAPSDADDSITIWFPELSVCVNNMVWPVLFNVFPVRGEEYRDPRVLLAGLEHIIGLEPEHLVGAHGPPISGKQLVQDTAGEYRDSIQFMWDQTVRLLNRGLTTDEMAHQIHLPELYNNRYTTQQLYGLVEHHVRQIHNGLRGWFDGDESKLFPVEPLERVTRLIAGFGGADEVRKQADAAIAGDDLRWALELSTWLVRSGLDDSGRIDGGTLEDRNRLADVLRKIGSRTTSANIRNWCMTRALELEGTLDLSRFRVHRISRHEVLNRPADTFVGTLRVLLVPEKADGVDARVRFEFADGTVTGLHVRRSVAVQTDGSEAENSIALDLATWALIVGDKLSLSEAIDNGSVVVSGDEAQVRAIFNCFDHQALSS